MTPTENDIPRDILTTLRTLAQIRNEWPPEFLELSAEVQSMYRYAVANEATLKWFPCYCGCAAGGHRSNFDCYVREVLFGGPVRLDTMSFG